MSKQIPEETAEKILGSITLPPCPAVIGDLIRERNKPNPNMREMGRLIAKDVALSAAMLKTVNSPFFGLNRRIGSPQEAVLTLGLANVANIITALSLKTVIGDKAKRLERFWDSAERVANIATHLAARVPEVDCNMAYTYGLFHHCAIPLLMEKFPGYGDTLQRANGDVTRSYTAIEEERHATNHATVGYFFARSWGLPDAIGEAIRNHHELALLSSSEELSAEARGLMAVVRVAEHIGGTMKTPEDEEAAWESTGYLAMDYLGISREELEESKAELTDS